MTTRINEDLLCPAGFQAAKDAMMDAFSNNEEEDGQLAAGIVAYCTFMTETKLLPLVGRRAVGTTAAQDIGREHAAK